MQIIWSDDAIEDYRQNIEYLLSRWGEKLASAFIEEVDTVLELLIINPDIYPLVDHHSIRRAVVRKQVALYYKIEGKSIYLVRFWNTYQDPETLEL